MVGNDYFRKRIWLIFVQIKFIGIFHMNHDPGFRVELVWNRSRAHILNLSDADKSELLKWFVSQMLDHPVEWDLLAEVTKRVQDWEEGKIKPMSHEEFWAGIDQNLKQLSRKNE